jgi:hypothetical protein
MIGAAPQVLEQPCCDVINRLPWQFFLAVHVALFLVGAYFAYRAFEARHPGFGWGFTLFALAEVSYMTYHINLTQFLFAHTISEVLDGVAFAVLFASALGRVAVGVRGTEAGLGVR